MNKYIKRVSWISMLLIIIFSSIYAVSGYQLSVDLGTNRTTNDGFSVIGYQGKPIRLPMNLTSGTVIVDNIIFHVGVKAGAGINISLRIVNSSGQEVTGWTDYNKKIVETINNTGYYNYSVGTIFNPGLYWIVFTTDRNSASDFWRLSANKTTLEPIVVLQQCSVANLSNFGCSGTWNAVWYPTYEDKYNLKVYTSSTSNTTQASYNVTVYTIPNDINSTLVGNVSFIADIKNLTSNTSFTDGYAILHYNISTKYGQCPVITAGTCTYPTNFPNEVLYDMIKVNDTSFRYNLAERYIFPAYYPFEEVVIESTPYTGNYSVYLNNNIKFIVLNFTNYTTPYLSVEFNAYNLTPSSLMNIYYCNSSYSTGNPATNANCEFVENIPSGTIDKNHCHGKSCHFVFNINIQNVTKTKNSTFLIVSNTPNIGDSWNFPYILNTTYRNNSFQIGNYNTWSSTPFIFDMHIHQYDRTEGIKYYVTYVDGYNVFANASTNYTDYFDVAPQIPTTSILLTPNSTSRPTVTTSQYTLIYFRWTQSFDFEGSPLTYNLSLVNVTNGVRFAVIYTSDLNYTYNVSALILNAGSYYGLLKVCDNTSLCATSISDTFYVCQNTWTATLQPCITNVKLLSYYDSSSCEAMYDLPSDNNTNIACVTPATEGEETISNAIFSLALVVLAIILYMIIYRGDRQ